MANKKVQNYREREHQAASFYHLEEHVLVQRINFVHAEFCATHNLPLAIFLKCKHT